LRELLSLHHAMLQWAKEGKWEAVAAGEKIRRERLEDFFQIPVSEQQLPKVRAALQTMLDINGSLVELLSKDRGGVERDIGAIQKGRRAVAAYGQFTGSSRQPMENGHSG